MGGEGRLIFFFGTVEVGWKKECSRAKDTPSLDYIDCVDLGEMCIIDRGEGNYSRKKNYFDGVVMCKVGKPTFRIATFSTCTEYYSFILFETIIPMQ